MSEHDPSPLLTGIAARRLNPRGCSRILQISTFFLVGPVVGLVDDQSARLLIETAQDAQLKVGGRDDSSSLPMLPRHAHLNMQRHAHLNMQRHAHLNMHDAAAAT
jgi:hypothetical protein